MQILVCVKQVPGSNRVEVDPETGVLKRSGVKGKLNPYDLYAIELAVQLKERFGGSVTALTMGPPQAGEALRETVYMGADRGVLLTDRAFAGADVLATARALAGAIQSLGAFDVILCGKQTTDGDTAQVGAEFAELLGLEHASNLLSVEGIDDGRITVRLNQEHEIVTQRMQLPCVLCTEGQINTPRLPSYLRKKAARDDVVTAITLADLADSDPAHFGLNGSATQVERIFPPERNDDRVTLTGDADSLAQQLLDVLHARKFL